MYTKIKTEFDEYDILTPDDRVLTTMPDATEANRILRLLNDPESKRNFTTGDIRHGHVAVKREGQMRELAVVLRHTEADVVLSHLNRKR